jgi:hypothetical protein
MKKNSLAPKKCVKVEKVSELRGITVTISIFMLLRFWIHIPNTDPDPNPEEPDQS